MLETNKRTCQRECHDSVIEAYDKKWRKIIWTAKLVDFSESGVRFHSMENLDSGEPVRARIRIFGKGVIEVEGQIVWRRLKGNLTLYGLKFISKEKLSLPGDKK